MSELNHWKTDKLFDDTPYIHRYKFPNVIPLPVRVVENTGHDEAFDHLKCDATQDDIETDQVRAKLFDFPRRLRLPTGDEAA
jgi:hypothetical protein